jgi:uncharacterized protein
VVTPDILRGLTGFQWDEGNAQKNWRRHQVTQTEAEQVFFHQPLVLQHDATHSREEEVRFFVLGQTDAGRELMVVFTTRNDKIRIISARAMSRQERRVYAAAKKA